MVREKKDELKSFSNDIVEKLGDLKTPFSCNDLFLRYFNNLVAMIYWNFPKTNTTVVEDGFEPIFGCDLFDQLRITISQKSCPKHEVNKTEIPCAIKQSLAKEFPEIISRIGKSKNQTANSKILRNYRVTHPKVRKVPIHLQPKVKIELEKLLNEGLNGKLSNFSDQFFISPNVIIVAK